jgi:hypothetical protein
MMSQLTSVVERVIGVTTAGLGTAVLFFATFVQEKPHPSLRSSLRDIPPAIQSEDSQGGDDFRKLMVLNDQLQKKVDALNTLQNRPGFGEISSGIMLIGTALIATLSLGYEKILKMKDSSAVGQRDIAMGQRDSEKQRNQELNDRANVREKEYMEELARIEARHKKEMAYRDQREKDLEAAVEHARVNREQHVAAYEEHVKYFEEQIRKHMDSHDQDRKTIDELGRRLTDILMQSTRNTETAINKQANVSISATGPSVTEVEPVSP